MRLQHYTMGLSVCRIALLSAGLFAAGHSGNVCAQTQLSYPHKVVRIITTAPGSGTELVARIIARGLTARLGQQVIVDNRGIIGVAHMFLFGRRSIRAIMMSCVFKLLSYIGGVSTTSQAVFLAFGTAFARNAHCQIDQQCQRHKCLNNLLRRIQA